jgi:hypothetical protein
MYEYCSQEVSFVSLYVMSCIARGFQASKPIVTTNAPMNAVEQVSSPAPAGHITPMKTASDNSITVTNMDEATGNLLFSSPTASMSGTSSPVRPLSLGLGLRRQGWLGSYFSIMNDTSQMYEGWRHPE